MEDVIDLLDSRKPGVREMDIALAEKELGIKFPTQYREVMKLTNNAQIGDWTLYPIKNPSDLKRTWDDIVRQNKEAKEEEMNDELISIGEDGSGDRLCFKALHEVMDGKVYIWDHETGEDELVASSLKEFILTYGEE